VTLRNYELRELPIAPYSFMNGLWKVKGPVCKYNESVQGLHVGFYSTNRFKLPVNEQVVFEVKT